MCVLGAHAPTAKNERGSMYLEPLSQAAKAELYDGYHVEVLIHDCENDLVTNHWKLYSYSRPRTLVELKSWVQAEMGSLPGWLATLQDPNEYIGVEEDSMQHPKFRGAYCLLDIEGKEGS